MALRSRTFAFLCVVAAMVAAPTGAAYTVEGGDVLIRPVVGASVNAWRLDAATRETAPGGMIMGLDVDYALDGPWNLTAAVRPALWPGYFDANIGLGGKYRLTSLDMPFVPYASAMLTVAGATKIRWVTLPHANIGVRPAFGFDYFVMKNLAVTAEVATEVSLLLYPMLHPEVNADAIVGISYRFDVL